MMPEHPMRALLPAALLLASLACGERRSSSHASDAAPDGGFAHESKQAMVDAVSRGARWI
jgi:hypothetical protein